jgi:hypothetical protein
MLKMQTEQALSLDYISGFFDGEGCISLGFSSKPNTNKRSWWPYVRVILTSADKCILERVRNKIKVGTIYIKKKDIQRRAKLTSGNRNDYFQLIISDTNQVLIFLDAIEKTIIIKLAELRIAQNACRFIIEHRFISKRRWSEAELRFYKLNFVDKIRVVPNSKRDKCGRKRKVFLPVNIL